MRKLILVPALVIVGFALATANPLPPYNISEYSTSPPWIELTCYAVDSLNLSGLVIHTMSGDVVVDNGVFAHSGQSIVLDSGNTSGFSFNPEGDSIVIDSLYIAIGFGCRGGYAVPPVAGESAEWTHWHNGEMNFSVATSPGMWGEAAPCNWGQTSVVINEINAHGTWEQGCGFVELYNRSSAPVNISGWQIVCDNRHYVPSGTTIPGHGHYVLDERLYPGAFGLSPDCDNVYLLNASEALVDQAGWSSNHGENVCFMRFPNGGPDTMNFDYYTGFNDETSIGFSEGFPSRGAPNRIENPGLKVIGTRAELSGGYVNIYWTNPVWFTVFDQVILRKSTTGFPQTPFDGELLLEAREQEYLYDQVLPGQTAYYTVFARTSCGEYSIPDSEAQASIMMPMGVGDEGPIPKKAALLECFPNPFNARVTIRFTVDMRSSTELSIYNLGGQRVTTLANDVMSAGEHRIIWDAAAMPSGIYFARLDSKDRSGIAKLTLLK
jgi:hypothetical protein